MNRKWIEDHADEILNLFKNHIHCPPKVGIYLHTHSHKPAKNYSEIDIYYQNEIWGRDWIRCYHPDHGWVVHSTKYHV